uniref:Putative ovule protein n=1 Tax=Solanum chacoense TaxID=4108 RepID=A0A0V0GIQ4_SOLCH
MASVLTLSMAYDIRFHIPVSIIMSKETEDALYEGWEDSLHNFWCKQVVIDGTEDVLNAIDWL